MLKIRSDIIIPNIDRFIYLLEQKIQNEPNKIFIIAYQINSDTIMLPVDYITFGRTEQMIKFWNVMTDPSLLDMGIPAELVLNINYTGKNNFNLDNKNDIYEFNTYYGYFIEDINKDGIQIYWLSKYFDKYAHPTLDNCVFVNRYVEDPFYGY
ncbi:MAG: hypothetical protein Homavirus40_2 [Homavirus sp.]|uniref:Uncharacterized protein n=1 Tax=Homavirus sp. TaxID=2487769 RepID=A0A3G5A555_9VIRU|nr:MAG: hypothetical protein Homavirus40_2 [Homavirus sp.]